MSLFVSAWTLADASLGPPFNISCAVGLDLDFRVGQIPSPAFAVTKTVRHAPSLTIGGRGLEERVLLLVSIGGDELIGVNLGQLHSVAACCWC